MDRRTALGAVATAPVAAAACGRADPASAWPERPAPDLVRNVEPLAFPWKTLDPFLFCAHHDDAYPAGNEQMGPAASLAGRNLGSDFGGKDGWNMYHGDVVPGFPQHPHRGFETITFVRRGLIDHADSLGAKARYGRGDVQWLTAGRGVVHAEMFPLLERGAPNPLELFQIWLNLPKADKFADPHFVMFWGDTVPKKIVHDAAGRATEITVVAGALGDARPPGPPPKSWASRPESDVAVWALKMAPGARFALPPAAAGSNRVLYAYRGRGARVGDRDVPARHSVALRPDAAAPIENGPEEGEFLLLQGRPIGEPVVQYGPFVMNSQAEIRQAYADYQRTRFGGWPWPSHGPVHGAEGARFAQHPDGRLERAG
jgi:redox-sensitive bicupin YhaK (pirin superfamily)